MSGNHDHSHDAGKGLGISFLINTSFVVIEAVAKIFSTTRKGLARTLLYTAVVICFSFSFVGFGHVFLNVDTQTGSCPLMPGGAACNSNTLQHLEAAQNISNALPQQSTDVTAMLLLLSLAVLLNTLRKQTISAQYVSIARSFLPVRYYVSPRWLQEAFSNGIIHSRAF